MDGQNRVPPSCLLEHQGNTGTKHQPQTIWRVDAVKEEEKRQREAAMVSREVVKGEGEGRVLAVG